jgi:hypothetical protein
MKAFMVQNDNYVSYYEMNMLFGRKKSLTIEYFLWKLYSLEESKILDTMTFEGMDHE